MKQLFYTLLIFGLIYFCYWYITRTDDIVTVTGALRVLDEKTPGNSYNASIYGTAANSGDIPAKDIWIVYKIEDEEVTAFIDELQPKQSVKFRTGVTRIKIKEPDVELVSIKYDK